MDVPSTQNASTASRSPGIFDRLYLLHCLAVTTCCLGLAWHILREPLLLFFTTGKTASFWEGAGSAGGVNSFAGAIFLLAALGHLEAALLLCLRSRHADSFIRGLCLLSVMVIALFLLLPHGAAPVPTGDYSDLFLYSCGGAAAALGFIWSLYFSKRDAPLAQRAVSARGLLAALCLTVAAANGAAFLRALWLIRLWSTLPGSPVAPEAEILGTVLSLLPSMGMALWLALLARDKSTPVEALHFALAGWVLVCLVQIALPLPFRGRPAISLAETVLCIALAWWMLGTAAVQSPPASFPGADQTDRRSPELYPRFGILLVQRVQDRLRSGRLPGVLAAFLAVFAYVCAFLEQTIITTVITTPATLAQFNPQWSSQAASLPAELLLLAVALCFLPLALLGLCSLYAIKGHAKTVLACRCMVWSFFFLPAAMHLVLFRSLWIIDDPEEMLFIISTSLLFAPGGSLVLYAAFLRYLGKSRKSTLPHGVHGLPGPVAPDRRQKLPVAVFALFCLAFSVQYAPIVYTNAASRFQMQEWLQQGLLDNAAMIPSMMQVTMNCLVWFCCPILCLAALCVLLFPAGRPVTPGRIAAVEGILLFWLACGLAYALLQGTKAYLQSGIDSLALMWSVMAQLLPVLGAALTYAAFIKRRQAPAEQS